MESEVTAGGDTTGTIVGEGGVTETADRFSTIPEEDESQSESIHDYLSHSDEQFQSILDSTATHCSQFLEGSIPEDDSDSDQVDESVYRTPLSLCLPMKAENV